MMIKASIYQETWYATNNKDSKYLQKQLLKNKVKLKEIVYKLKYF